MANALYSFCPFDLSGIQGDFSPLEDYQMKDKQNPFFSMEELGQVYPLCTQYGAYQDNDLNFFKDQPPQQQQLPQPATPGPRSNCLISHEYFNSYFPAPAQPMQEVKKSENIPKSTHPFALSSSLELLSNYASSIKKMNQNQSQSSNISSQNLVGDQKKLSTEEIIRVAGTRYIQFSDQRYDDFSTLMHPFGYALSGLSVEQTRDVELVHLLLAAAEKVGYQQFDRANRLLSRCEWIASDRANPVQRVVYGFAAALRERIDKATGRFTPKGTGVNTRDGFISSVNLACLCVHQNVPFNQIAQLTSIQAIIENIGTAKKLHVIDLHIQSGVEWTAMMQALAEREGRPLEHLKVTALCLPDKLKMTEETGGRLENFAESMNFPFTFKSINVSSMNEIKEELFEIVADESLVVVSNTFLRSLISTPDSLENLMRVIKNLNPSLMLVYEVEANHNSPIFVNRFIEALFFYSAYFDCVETCMDKNPKHRSTIEAIFSEGINKILTIDNSERSTRNVNIDVWRAFFTRFRMVEVGFSESSLYQASLVPKRFSSGSSVSLDKNGKCLIIGWKGTPLHSLSAWKFSRERLGRSFANYRFST